MVQSRREQSDSSSKKLNLELPNDPSIPFLGMFPEKLKAYSHRYLYRMFTVAFFTTATRWNQPKCPTTDDYINKMWYILAIQPQKEKKY